MTLPYGGTPPYKKHGGDAGWDLAALENTTIPPQSSTMIELATRVNIPKGYVGLLTLRSSIAAPTPHNLAHHLGTIDAGYTGPLKIIVWNHGNEPYPIKAGERIAQLIILPTPHVELTPAANLGVTQRGDKGFGSTGK